MNMPLLITFHEYPVTIHFPNEFYQLLNSPSLDILPDIRAFQTCC